MLFRRMQDDRFPRVAFASANAAQLEEFQAPALVLRASACRDPSSRLHPRWRKRAPCGRVRGAPRRTDRSPDSSRNIARRGTAFRVSRAAASACRQRPATPAAAAPRPQRTSSPSRVATRTRSCRRGSRHKWCLSRSSSWRARRPRSRVTQRRPRYPHCALRSTPCRRRTPWAHQARPRTRRSGRRSAAG